MRNPRFAASVIVLLVVAAGAVVYRLVAGPALQAVGQTTAVPEMPRYRGGHWYWLDHPSRKSARLLRDAQVLTSAADISGLAANDTTVAWAADEGGHWTIYGSKDGAAPVILAERKARPSGFAESGGVLYWTEAAAPLVPGVPLPAITSHVHIYSTPLDRPGAEPKDLATLTEGAGEVVGVRGGSLYAVGRRNVQTGVFALYRLPANGGMPERVTADLGGGDVVVTSNGKLYWSACSREASDFAGTTCLRSMDATGKPVTLTEWLPAGGYLVAADGEPRYIGGFSKREIWPVAPPGELPRPNLAPSGYEIVGGDEGHVLLSRPASKSKSSVFSMRVP